MSTNRQFLQWELTQQSPTANVHLTLTKIPEAGEAPYKLELSPARLLEMIGRWRVFLETPFDQREHKSIKGNGSSDHLV